MPKSLAFPTDQLPKSEAFCFTEFFTLSPKGSFISYWLPLTPELSLELPLPILLPLFAPKLPVPVNPTVIPPPFCPGPT